MTNLLLENLLDKQLEILTTVFLKKSSGMYAADATMVKKSQINKMPEIKRSLKNLKEIWEDSKTTKKEWDKKKSNYKQRKKLKIEWWVRTMPLKMQEPKWAKKNRPDNGWNNRDS